jgi:hypothetical protein
MVSLKQLISMLSTVTASGSGCGFEKQEGPERPEHSGQITLLMNRNHGHQNQQEVVTGKVPPSWDPAQSREYPYRIWVQDLKLWSGASDLAQEKQGPAVALRLHGAARQVAREMDYDRLVNGTWGADQHGQAIQLRTGLEDLVQMLSTRFAPLPQESQIFAISELFSFRKSGGENIDEAISRFEVLYFRASQVGGVNLNETIRAFMVLQSCHIPVDKWPVLLIGTQGSLPNNRQEYDEFIMYLRRNGHLFDRNGDPATTLKHHFANETSATMETAEIGSMFLATPGARQEGGIFLIGTCTIDEHGTDVFVTDELESEASDEEDDYSSIDISDMVNMTEAEAGEHLFTAYQHAKRRWRKFQRHKGRSHSKVFRRKHKGSGKGFARGSGMFGQGKGHNFVSQEDLNAIVEAAYFKGKGAGKGKGKGPRLNPIGADGKRMRCSTCGAEDHFRAKCPRQSAPAPGFLIGAADPNRHIDNAMGIGHWTPESPAVFSGFTGGDNSIVVPKPTTTVAFYNMAMDEAEDRSRIHYSDGSEEWLTARDVRTLNQLESGTASSSEHRPGARISFLGFNHGSFPVWETASAQADQMQFLATDVKLTGNREGLLVDCGAVGNLTGDRWVQRVEQIAAGHQQKVQRSNMKKSITVDGVGKGAEQCVVEATVPIALSNGTRGTFQAPVISNSDIPALLGLRTLEGQRTLIDSYHHKLMMIGAGGYEIKLSPGSVVLPLEKSPSGHLLLPITEWGKLSNEQRMALLSQMDNG